MKSITVKGIEKVEGFCRMPEYDFKDDGNKFTGWSYKGLPITQHVSRDYGTFLSFRVDYLNEHTMLPVHFSYSEWMELPEHDLCRKWNGVEELPSYEELAAAGDKIIAAIKALNEKVDSEVVETGPLVARAALECSSLLRKVIEFRNVDLFDERLSNSDVVRIRDYIKSIKMEAEQCKVIANELLERKLSARQVREIKSRYEQYGYVRSHYEDNYYVKQVQEIISKLCKEAA